MRNEVLKHQGIEGRLLPHISVRLVSEVIPKEIEAILGGSVEEAGELLKKFATGAVILRGESFVEAHGKFDPVKRGSSVSFVGPAEIKDGKLVACGITIFPNEGARPFINSSDSLILLAAKLGKKV